MKSSSTSLLLIVFCLLICQSCEQKQHAYVGLLTGSWRMNDSLQQEIYEFKKGSFKKQGVYDTMFSQTEGLYFINENKKRNSVTLTLVPNDLLPYDPEMIIMMPCENFDIVSINGEKMVVVKSVKVPGALGNVYRADADTLWRIND
jgi:hypothetical protein